MVNSGAHVNEKLGEWDLRPLHLAAWYNQPRLIDLLIQLESKPDKQDRKSQKTPLHIAAYLGHLEAWEALIKAGAHSNQQGVYHWMPMHYAAAQGHLEIIKHLFYHGAPLHCNTKCGNILNIELSPTKEKRRAVAHARQKKKLLRRGWSQKNGQCT